MTAPAGRISLRDAAVLLGVHYQTAYRWVRQGALPALKVGGSYEVTLDAVAALQRDRARPAPPPAQRRIRDWGVFVERLYRSLLAGDEGAARDTLADLVGGGLALSE